MSKKIYLATSWRNPEQPHILKMLRDEGHLVYDFRDEETAFRWSDIDPRWLRWSPQEFRRALTHPKARAGFRKDRDAMLWANMCVLLTPCGRSAHLEAGFMAGQGKRVAVLLRQGEAELMYCLLGDLCVSEKELLEALD